MIHEYASFIHAVSMTQAHDKRIRRYQFDISASASEPMCVHACGIHISPISITCVPATCAARIVTGVFYFVLIGIFIYSLYIV